MWPHVTVGELMSVIFEGFMGLGIIGMIPNFGEVCYYAHYKSLFFYRTKLGAGQSRSMLPR